MGMARHAMPLQICLTTLYLRPCNLAPLSKHAAMWLRHRCPTRCVSSPPRSRGLLAKHTKSPLAHLEVMACTSAATHLCMWLLTVELLLRCRQHLRVLIFDAVSFAVLRFSAMDAMPHGRHGQPRRLRRIRRRAWRRRRWSSILANLCAPRRAAHLAPGRLPKRTMLSRAARSRARAAAPARAVPPTASMTARRILHRRVPQTCVCMRSLRRQRVAPRRVRPRRMHLRPPPAPRAAPSALAFRRARLAPRRTTPSLAASSAVMRTRVAPTASPPMAWTRSTPPSAG